MIGIDLLFQLIDTSCIIMILIIELAQFLVDKHSNNVIESMAHLSLPTMAVDTTKQTQ